MPHLTHPEDGMVWACPYCDHAAVQLRHPLHPASQGDTPCWCRECREEFEAPVPREARSSTTPTHRLGGKSKLEALLDEHPEIREEHGVGFEQASALRTDGGTLQFDDLDEGDKIRVDGETFTIQQTLDDVLSLVPRNENGSGRLQRIHEDLWVFNRRRGVEPSDVEVVEG